MTFPKATQKEASLLLFINWDVTQKSSLFVALGYLIRKTNDHCMKSIILGAELKISNVSFNVWLLDDFD